MPVGDSKDEPQDDAEVATILCSVRNNECLVIDSIGGGQVEQVWIDGVIDEFKAASWDSSGILATGRSGDGCTDETLKIRFSPPSVVIVNSPVLPMSDRCKKINTASDKLFGKGWTLAGRMEQDELVPTRSPVALPFQDFSSPGKAPTHATAKKP